MTTFNSGMDSRMPKGEERSNCPRVCNIDIVNPTFRSWHRIKRWIAQSITGFGDPQGNSYGKEISPSGSGINTDVEKERKDTRELLGESTLGTGLPCLKKDRPDQGDFSFAIAIIEPTALRYRQDIQDGSRLSLSPWNIRCIDEAFLADNVCEGREVMEIYSIQQEIHLFFILNNQRSECSDKNIPKITKLLKCYLNNKKY